MAQEIKSDTWIWVIVQDPGANEQFLGQLDEDNGRVIYTRLLPEGRCPAMLDTIEDRKREKIRSSGYLL